MAQSDLNSSMDNLHGQNLTDDYLQTKSYAVVWSGFLLIFMVLVGTVPNFAILAASRCKRHMRTWRYALIYSLCVLNIFFCMTWIPLNFGVVLTSHMEHQVHFVACYLHVTLLHFCTAALISTTIFLGIQRLSAIWSDTYEKNVSNVFIIIGLVLSWVAGGLCALYVSVHHFSTYSYIACTDPKTTLAVSGLVIKYHWAETILCLIYIAALVSTLVIFVVLSLCRQQSMGTQCNTRKTKNCNYHGIPNTHGRDEDDRIMSTISQQSPTKSSLRENSETKKSSGTLASISKKVCLQEPTAEDIHNISDVDDNDDDDAFDLKMRLKLAKRSSGRRHTVANIGHSEAGFKGRRGSMDDARAGPHPANYQYVRKWSVDIVALQDQLENPKIHPMPFKELVELHDKKQKETENSNSSQNNIKEMPENTDTDERNVKVKDNDLKVIKEQISEEGELSALCAPDPVSTSSVEVPAITVKRSNHSNTDEVIVQTYEDDVSPQAEEQKEKLQQHLLAVWRSMMLLVVPIVCLMPLCVMLTMADYSVSVKYVLSSFLVLQCPLYPILLAWVDASIGHALRRLLLKMTSLRCVCYCNIGKRRRCFGPPEYS